MITGFYTPDVNTIKDADDWISSNVVANQKRVCLICASTKDAFKVEVQEAGASGYTTIAEIASDTGDTQMDWMFYTTKTDGAQIKTTGTGFMRVQGILVPEV